ncbi:CBS domain-containing protein [Pseudomaricurvus alkylphenolicus]|uniref:CBS domain-containing protein n=1 Tax=Pseudomaricurvus alkylphenolicus TaxID=1306991 RepID=UPI001422ADBC|nr:CBS domain-containing protein [Pseudomaricurvus alkylphenolicus]NIB42757.1 CBS domain-containing protein [Pseudomaricurvus alkylphenolicus]
MQTLNAQDIMNSNVMFAYEGWSIKYLATFFKEKNISGAPVVAPDNELVGVVSVTDIFQFENQDMDAKVAALRDYYQSAYGDDLHINDLQSWSHNAEENCTVHQIMKNRVISVTGNTSVSEVCRVMLNNKIHRVFVTDEGKVKGVITTSNLLTVLAESGE